MPNYPVYDPADVEAQLRRLKGDDSFDDVLSGDNVVLERARYYRKMSENPRGAGRLAPVGTPEMIRAVEALSAAAPNFSEVSGVVLRAIALSMQTDTPLSIPPLLFLGPPGVGKTFFSRSLAQALGVPYAEYSMALADDPGELVGHTLSWRGARPGLVARTLIEGWSVAPVILVDEVEKTQWSNYGNPLDVFHTLLEPESARAFRDAYLDIPLRADKDHLVLHRQRDRYAAVFAHRPHDRRRRRAAERSATRRDHSVALQPIYRSHSKGGSIPISPTRSSRRLPMRRREPPVA